MKVIDSYPGRVKENLCPTQLETIQVLIRLLEKVDLPQNSREGTTSLLRSQIDESLDNDGWQEGQLIDHQVSLEFPTANYTMDLGLVGLANACGHKHRYTLEFCFDNRQAIGTNLLKFEVASINAISQNWDSLPILVCATAGAIKQFGWDGGVASYQEYDHAIRVPYKSVLHNPPVLLAIF